MKKKTLKKDLAHGSHLQDSPQQILKVLKMTKMWQFSMVLKSKLCKLRFSKGYVYLTA